MNTDKKTAERGAAKNLPKVYAYGVMPLYGSQSGEPFDPVGDTAMAVYAPYAYLHYWIDANLTYHQRILTTDAIPECGWITGGSIKVELRGPSDYTVSVKN